MMKTKNIIITQLKVITKTTFIDINIFNKTRSKSFIII